MKIMKIIMGVVIGWLLMSQIAYSASFACNMTETEVEKLICINIDLLRLDQDLDREYKKALERSDIKQMTIESQREWLKNERDVCQNVECIKASYEKRITELRFTSSFGIIFSRPSASSAQTQKDTSSVDHYNFQKPYSEGQAAQSDIRERAVENESANVVLISPSEITKSTSFHQDKAWFMPMLIQDRHKLCGEILNDARTLFLSDEKVSSHYFSRYGEESKSIAGMTSVRYDSHLDNNYETENIQGGGYKHVHSSSLPTVIIGEEKYHLQTISLPHCSGGCDQYELPLPEKVDSDSWASILTKYSYYSFYYQLYKSDSNSDWLFVIGDHETNDNLHVFRLTDGGNWEQACEVQFRPSDMSGIEIVKAQDSLNKLKSSVFGLTRGAGNCGSMRTHEHWADEFTNILPTVLYRPWALKDPDYDEYGFYSNDMVGLNDWALTGLSEYSSFIRYVSQLEQTILDISDFYQEKNGWDKAESMRAAMNAITAAVSTTIRFYMYDPIRSEDERTLRTAILEQRPLDQFNSIELSIKDYERDGDESLLSSAVLYPAALQNLLGRGFNPNHENAFGKTPLMYAVQYNQYQSVKILLEAGADPNARTTRPWDSCYYTLRTFNMTPLHYAVRYASPEIIKLLLDHGASRFIKAEQIGMEETPLDWFRRYTSYSEINANIPTEKIALIESWLNENNDNTTSGTSDEFVLKAERLYKKNRISEAYQALGLALVLDPENERALSDMSLVALKNGKYGQSIEAGMKLVDPEVPDKLAANAWFNIGLACETYKIKVGSGYITYNGQLYCDYSSLSYFYNAAIRQKSEARENKILETIDASPDTCDIPTEKIKIYFQNGGRNTRLFVLHDADVTVDAEALAWKICFYDAGSRDSCTETKIVPRKINALEIGSRTLDLFVADYNVKFPYTFMGHQCMSGRSGGIKTHDLR